ncbi:serpin family protein [Nesterenkonia flava]|uniref:Serpin family protein n=1 Tax=Nesterenkonia flava TaxID=469799 RepID=A0ABU1FRM3_9MICC|nr:serpin family protein [Nesterenkonia flava]MDR5711312.1 serpin family protein [Nesterenkonia flava]
MARGVNISRTALAGAALGGLALTSCGAETAPDPQQHDIRSDVVYEPASLSSATAVADVVDRTTAFGTSALADLSQGETNAVISPASLTVALAMLAEGAQGPAAAELDEFLGAAGDERSHAFSALQSAVLDYDGDPALVQDEELPEAPLLHLANQLVLQQGADVDDDVLDALSRYFDAGLVSTDFGDAESKELLDAWVHHHTGGLIEESAIVAPDPNIEFVLQNAVLMAAQWRSPFDPANTADREFTTLSGGTVEVPMMRQTVDVPYAEHDGAQAVRLPYTERFSMDVVLPDAGTDPAQFTARDWAAIDEAFGEAGTSQRVDVTMPVLDLETSAELIPLLQDQGLAATVGGDDLSPLAAGELGQVSHQVVLQVDEEGTVAAGVTEISMITSGPLEEEDPVELRVDRPYTLRIVHEETGWPLFMAVIYNPAE